MLRHMRTSYLKFGKERWIKISINIKTHSDTKSGSTTLNTSTNTTADSNKDLRLSNLKWTLLLTWHQKNSEPNIWDLLLTSKSLINVQENKLQLLIFQLKLIGPIKVLSLQLKIKANVDHVGPSQLPDLWKDLTSFQPPN